MDDISVGSAVRLCGGGPVMTVIAEDEPPPQPDFTISEVSPSPLWKPGGWRVAWHVQGALRTAVLPGAALRLVSDTV
jgi:hypothetical protein